MALSHNAILGGTDLNSAIQHSGIKKADGSSAKKHQSTKEHKSNRASLSVTHAPGDSSVKYQASSAQSDSDDEVSTSCFCIKRKRKKVAPKQKPSMPARDKVYKKKYKVAAAVVAALVIAPAAVCVAALVAPGLLVVLPAATVQAAGFAVSLGSTGAAALAASSAGVPVLAV